jgi:uncharacterized protein YhjY with autotransporter beta-barrel domain
VTPRAIAYVSHSGGPWGVDAGIGVARSSFDVERRLAFTAFAPTGRPLFGGVDTVATSRPSALALDLWAQGRFNHAIGLWSTVATAGLRSGRLRMSDWREEGADGLSLSAGGQRRTSTQADARLQIMRRVGRAAPWFSASYRRELADSGAATNLRIGDVSDGDFTVGGQPLPRATAIGMAGVTLSATRAQMSMSYQIRRADQQMRHVLQLAFGFD